MTRGALPSDVCWNLQKRRGKVAGYGLRTLANLIHARVVSAVVIAAHTVPNIALPGGHLHLVVVELVKVHHASLRIQARINQAPQARRHGLPDAHLSVELVLDARRKPELLRLLLPSDVRRPVPSEEPSRRPEVRRGHKRHDHGGARSHEQHSRRQELPSCLTASPVGDPRLRRPRGWVSSSAKCQCACERCPRSSACVRARLCSCERQRRAVRCVCGRQQVSVCVCESARAACRSACERGARVSFFHHGVPLGDRPLLDKII